MSRICERFTIAGATLAVLVPVMLLAVPANTSAGQGRNRGGESSGSGGQAVPRGASPAPAPSPAPATREAAPAPAPRSGPVQAKPRETPEAGSTTTTQDSGNSTGRREGRATARTAVARGSVPRPPRGGTTVIVAGGYYGGFWPWGFGGLGFGGYYGGALYDPYSPWYGGYGYGQSLSVSGPDGSMRLQIKPRDAQVFVDGFYAGIVDEFDGVFQRLHAQPGPHRIEVRAAGYETLTLDVEIRPDQTIKYEGELQRLP